MLRSIFERGVSTTGELQAGTLPPDQGCKIATEFFAFAISLSVAAISIPNCMNCFSGTGATSPLAMCLD